NLVSDIIGSKKHMEKLISIIKKCR
uniref:Homotarsinin n=1 Tax=Phyllomedusa tarsius TaxID=306084 RepID=HTRSN_PHYTS|nr:RecName: Full=Homotarsinin [Phyllomedusa tarsius]